MFGISKYNYDRFRKDVLLKDAVISKFGGAPEAGERAPDFEARTLDGDKIRLSDYRGEKNVVLTFGSATCPQTAASIGGINDLYEEYSGDDVEFLFVYVREAHPGEDLPVHRSIEDKVHAAEVLKEAEELEIPIAVDELNGKIHRKYGKLPNPTFIIDKSGRVAFRALVTNPKVIERALDELLERQEERDVDHAIVLGGEDRSVHVVNTAIHAHRALRRGGKDSMENFRQAFGTAGRIALKAGPVVEPIAENIGKTLFGIALGAAVIAAGVLAGRKLRQRRWEQRSPYALHELRRPRATGPTDYEAVGI